MTILFFCRELYAWSWPRRVLLYKNNANHFRMTILFFVEKYMLSLTRGMFYSTAWLPFGWHSYSFVGNYMLSLSQGLFEPAKIARLPFRWQSYSFIEKYLVGLSQSVFYSTTWLPFGWQSYSFVEKYMHNLGQGLFELTKIARLPFGWQSYSLVK